MRVLMVAASRENLPYHVVPIGTAYVASSLMAQRFDVDVLDLSLAGETPPLIASKIAAFAPDVVGVSIRNLDVVTYPHDVFALPLIRTIIDAIKSQTDAQIVIGGSGFSLLPVETLRYLGLRFGITGEGEYAFGHFLRCLESGHGLYDTPGLVALTDDGRVVSNPTSRVPSLDELPLPARDLIPTADYVASNVQTKRGCVFSCSYCTYPVLEGTILRKRAPEAVADELQAMIESFGTRRFDFVDNVFNVPVKHAAAICREIIRRGLPVEWTASVRPDFLPAELVTLMKRAGCVRLDVGTDAAAEPTLLGLSKGFEFDDIRAMAEVCREVGVQFSCYLILGAPGETEQTVHQTLTKMGEIDPPFLLGLTGVRVYPGTAIARQVRDEGFGESHDWFARSSYYIAPAVSDRLFDIVKEYTKQHQNWCFPGLAENVPPADLTKMMDYATLPDWGS